MLTVEGTYENGKIELLEHPPGEVKKARVLVTFVETKEISLLERGINSQQAADLRGRLKSIAEDWNRPEMDVYDET
jgi:hypothetical protein